MGWPAECRGGAEWDPERLQQLNLSGLDHPVTDTIQSSTVPFSSLAFARCPLNSPANPPRMQRSQLPNAALESVGGCNIPSLPRPVLFAYGLPLAASLPRGKPGEVLESRHQQEIFTARCQTRPLCEPCGKRALMWLTAAPTRSAWPASARVKTIPRCHWLPFSRMSAVCSTPCLVVWMGGLCSHGQG